MLLWLGAGFALATALLHGAADRVWLHALPEAQRNPGFRRGWFEFITADIRSQSPATGPRVVVISNSQGYGRELPPEALWPAQLEVALREAHPGAHVINWSAPAGQYFDLLLLAAAARDLRPDVLLAVIPSSAFDHEDGDLKTTRTWATDLHYLLQDAGLRARLDPADLTPRLGVRRRIDLLLSRLWAPWRWRAWPTACLARHPRLALWFPGVHGTSWYGVASQYRRDPPPLREQPFDPAALNRFYDQLAAAAPRVIVVDQPRVATWSDLPDPAWTVMAQTARDRGFEAFSLRAAVPDHAFITATHLDREGHRMVAAHLREVLP